MAVYPLDGVTYYISGLLVGTGTEGSSTGRQRRRGLGGHICLLDERSIELACDAAGFINIIGPSLAESGSPSLSPSLSSSLPSLAESGTLSLYHDPQREGYIQAYTTISYLSSIRLMLLATHHFKVVFHLHIMPAENRGNWYINDGAYQAQHEQGNILQ
jgi:hypothetical protein